MSYSYCRCSDHRPPRLLRPQIADHHDYLLQQQYRTSRYSSSRLVDLSIPYFRVSYVASYDFCLLVDLWIPNFRVSYVASYDCCLACYHYFVSTNNGDGSVSRRKALRSSQYPCGTRCRYYSRKHAFLGDFTYSVEVSRYTADGTYVRIKYIPGTCTACR